MSSFSSLVFYGFSFLAVLSAVMVIASRNPVHSVLFLIFTFFNAAGLFVLLGAEYVAMTLVIVYVGAVAVLFLFVVMMLDVSVAEWRQGFIRYLPLGTAVAIAFFVELGAIFYAAASRRAPSLPPDAPAPNPVRVGNTEAIGRLLYTEYVYAFQLAGIILLVGMIGAIVLTHRKREGVRRQKIGRQLARRREEGVVLVKVKPGEGV